MTVSTTATLIQYAGNGSTTVFAIPFTFDAGSEVEVTIITDSTNAITAQVDPTHYSISGSNVTMVTAPASGETLDVRLAVDYSQTTDLTANSSLPADSLEETYDELSKQIKQLKDIIDTQCVKLPKNILNSTTATDTDIQANYVFQVNATGDELILGPSTSATVAANGILNVVEDLTPQLGGDLDTNANWIACDTAYGIKDENGNEQLVTTTTSSAVNYANLINSATGNAVQLNAAGDDANISITIDGKGTGVFNNTTGITTSGTLTSTGAVDFGASTSFKIPYGATPTIAAAGDIGIDTTVTSHDSLLAFHDGSNAFFVPSIRQSDLSTTDNDVFVYDSATSRFKMEAQASGATAGALVLIESQTASASSELSFTSLDTGTYDELVLIGSNVLLSSASNDLEMVFSVDGGSTYLSTGYHLSRRGLLTVIGTWVVENEQSQAQFKLLDADYMDSQIGTNFKLNLHTLGLTPASTAPHRGFTGSVSSAGATTTKVVRFDTDGVLQTAAANDIDAIRIRPSAGTITSGSVRLYGIKKS